MKAKAFATAKGIARCKEAAKVPKMWVKEEGHSSLDGMVSTANASTESWGADKWGEARSQNCGSRSKKAVVAHAGYVQRWKRERRVAIQCGNDSMFATGSLCAVHAAWGQGTIRATISRLIRAV